MKIVADENITAVRDYFAELGELTCLPGRNITRAAVKNAGALLVRSVTQVNENLLRGTAVTFVGSATSGTDHVDTGYLERRGIAFHAAPGSNANSVTEYVLSALAPLTLGGGPDCFKSTVGIIGAGHVGGLLARKLCRLDIPCVIYDPFLDEAGDFAPLLRPLQDVLRQDIITLHTPLTATGPHPTHHMLNAGVIAGLRPGQVIINTARGAVMDGRALWRRLKEKGDLHTVLDTWENEPAIDPDLLALATIATPHVAGYSLDGKRRGTEMIHRAFRRLSGMPEKTVGRPGPGPFVIDLAPLGEAVTLDQAMAHCLLAAYDIRNDHERMRAACGSARDLPRQFDRLRKDYPPRYEFSHYRVINAGGGLLAERLAALDFQVS